MSEPLSKLVGLAKSCLQWYTEAANDPLEKKLNKLELDKVESDTEDFINRLSSNITILERCNKDWSTLLKETKGDAKVIEDREYARVAEGEEGCIEVMLIGNEVMQH